VKEKGFDIPSLADAVWQLFDLVSVQLEGPQVGVIILAVLLKETFRDY
jgi:hypothetical protein